MKITKKYCRELLARYEDDLPEVPTGADEIDESTIMQILGRARPTDRFYVNFDPSNYSEDEEDSWDIIGPGSDYGYLFYLSREEAENARDILNKILRDHFGPRKSDVRYTSEAYRAKVLLDGSSCCPVCGSKELVMNEHFFRDGVCNLFRGCRDCGGEWTEVYILHEYTNLKND